MQLNIKQLFYRPKGMGILEWKRIVSPVAFNAKPYQKVLIEITYDDSGQLRLCGSYGGDGAGQILDILLSDSVHPINGFSYEMAVRLYELWQRWHLNHMRAGTPRQELAIRAWKAGGNVFDYTAACAYLDSIGILYDNGYKYGSSSLEETVPEDVLEWLFALPGEGNTYDDFRKLYPASTDELYSFLGFCTTRKSQGAQP